jgi:hypothetical protein
MCKGIHNFWGEYRLSDILCLPVFRDLCALVRDSCVRGLHSIFGPLNIGTHRSSSQKTTHDATTEEVQEEYFHLDRPRRSLPWRRQRNLSHSRTFTHHRSRTKSKTWGSPESKSWEDNTCFRTIHRRRCSWRWWPGCRQRTTDSTTKNTAASERERNIHEPAGSKKEKLQKS